MKILAAGALALTVCAAQPTTVYAAGVAPAAASTSSGSAGAALPMAWAVGTFICTGLTWGKMKVQADRHHRKLTAADAFRGIGQCLIPPLGFAKLMRGR